MRQLVGTSEVSAWLLNPSTGLRTRLRTPHTVLVIDDDRNLTRLIEYNLTEEGYVVHVAHDGQEGWRTFFDLRPDLVILDIRMPQMDGWETCKRIREVSEVPIIMLTARANEQDIVRGLDMGADDYLTKPFQVGELLARVRAALRRAALPSVSEPDLSYTDDHLVIDLGNRRVLVQGEPIQLTATEFGLLAVMVKHADQVLSPRQLLEQVWGWEYMDDVHYVRVFVSRLRQKIEPDPKSPRYILTERGTGYRFVTGNR
ncbi:MAG: response regulator transcription factor [Anaerolineales bacterium]|nr:MAG: response regulator transcription factor [Anaerolineales bacterium]